MTATSYRATIRLCWLTLIIGVATGLIAAALTGLLHGIEYLVYGHHEGNVAVVVDGTTGAQRFWGVVIAGAIAGPVWAATRRYLAPVISVDAAMKGTKMPIASTIISIFVQMGTVAAGAPLGRENAPREGGALFANRLSHRLQIDPATTRILVAAAAGAGLGAIYQIPLAGAIFALEILLSSLTITAVMTVLACSAIATITCSLIVGTHTLYHPGALSTGWATIVAGLIIGAICGVLGLVFRKLMNRCEKAAPRAWHAAWAIPAAFLVVGVVSLWLPEVLGNGRSAATRVIEFSGSWSQIDAQWIGFVCALLAAKIILVALVFRAGAIGGLLTPSFAIGALSGFLVGVVLAPIFHYFDAPIRPSDFALLGAAAFLATSMAAPLFALIVTVEFTAQSSDAYLALFLTAATAALVATLVERRKPTADPSAGESPAGGSPAGGTTSTVALPQRPAR